MREDFPLIAKDFYVHEFANIPKHQDVEYFDIEAGEDWPELMFNRFTLGLMMNAVNSGSEYTKALFLYLHKTYYKKEYRTLKRFSKMSLSELLALAKPEGRRHLYYANLSRILCIAPMYGIKFDVKCHVVYGILNEFINKFGLSVGYSFDEDVGDSFKDCRKEIDKRFDQKKLCSLDAKMSKFLGNVFQWLGYSPKYADWCDENDRGVEDRLAIALSILKKTFPKSNREYSAEELTLYGMILHCASAMTCNSSWLAETLRRLAYGESGTFYYDEFPSMFHPEASGSTDVSIVDKADYVYFFTDTISHSTYHQFMNVIRERKINFGYIHGVNIEKNIRDIYVDFEED